MMYRQKGKTEYAQRRARRAESSFCHYSDAIHGKAIRPTQCICDLLRLLPQKEHAGFPANKVYFVAKSGKKSPDQAEFLRALSIQTEMVLGLKSRNTSRKAQTHFLKR